MLPLLILLFTSLIFLNIKLIDTFTVVKSIFSALRLTIMVGLWTFFMATLTGFTLLPDYLKIQNWLTTPIELIFYYLLGALVIGIVYFLGSIPAIKNRISEKKLSVADRVFFGVMVLLITLGLLITFSAYWAMSHFGELTIDQIVYHLTEPLTGSENSQIYAFIEDPLIKTFFFSSLIFEIFNFFSHYGIIFKARVDAPTKKSHPILRKFGFLSLGVLTLFGCFALALQRVGFQQVHSYFFESSKLYENEYKKPDKVQLTFPETKRNLIYIFLESVESSYFSTDLGGSQENNLMPNLANLAQTEGINFSNTDLLGGAQQVPGVGITVAAMVAQTAGVPIITTINGNDYGSTNNYMPGAYSIGEILAKQGYNQTLLIGSDASFGGRDKYFTQHGNYDIVDYNSAKENGWIPSDYNVWWGYEDAKLFEFAKNTVTDLASQPEPFNFTMLTADTHFEDGYVSAETPNLFDDQYSNVIHFSDQMLAEFLAWAKTQPFYANTTIVISGDHLTMDKNFFDDLDPDYTRTVFNLFLNSAVQPVATKNRQFSTLDMYPSTLAAMGVTIEGNRMGLGVNLFSSEKTLMEKYGLDELTSQLSQGSVYYQSKIMNYSEQQIVADTTNESK